VAHVDSEITELISTDELAMNYLSLRDAGQLPASWKGEFLSSLAGLIFTSIAKIRHSLLRCQMLFENLQLVHRCTLALSMSSVMTYQATDLNLGINTTMSM
jgi:hypothetical protein